MKYSIAITGAEIVSPLGIGLDSCSYVFSSTRKKYKQNDTKLFEEKVTDLLKKTHPQNVDSSKLSKYLLLTSYLLKEKLNIPIQNIVIGSALSSLSSIYAFEKTAQTKGYYGTNPQSFPDTVLNIPACRIALREKTLALCETLSTGICSGLDAVGMGCTYLNNNTKLASVICGGADEYNKELYYIFNPDQKFYGFGEGAALFKLERTPDALKHKKSILTEIIGYRTNQQADIMMNIETNIKNVLNENNIKPEEIDLIMNNKNGLSSIIDQYEQQALNKIFGTAKKTYTIKKQTGECLGLSGPLQILAAISFFQKNNTIKTVLLNNINPDGQITSLILKKHVP